MRTSRLLLIAGMLIAVGTVRAEALSFYGVCDPLSFYDKTKLGAPPEGPVEAVLVDITVECACQQNNPGNDNPNSESKWQIAHVLGITFGPIQADATYDKATGFVEVYKLIQPGPTAKFNKHFDADGNINPTHEFSYPDGDHVCGNNWHEIDHSCDPVSFYAILKYLGKNDKERYRIERFCEHNSTRESDGQLTSHLKDCFKCDNPEFPGHQCDPNCTYTCVTTFEGKVTGK